MKKLIMVMGIICMLMMNTLTYAINDELVTEGKVLYLCYKGLNDTYVVFTQNDGYLPSYYMLYDNIFKKYGKFYAKIHIKWKNMVGIVSIVPLDPLDGTWEGIWSNMVIPLERIVEIHLGEPSIPKK